MSFISKFFRKNINRLFKITLEKYFNNINNFKQNFFLFINFKIKI